MATRAEHERVLWIGRGVCRVWDCDEGSDVGLDDGKRYAPSGPAGLEVEVDDEDEGGFRGNDSSPCEFSLECDWDDDATAV